MTIDDLITLMERFVSGDAISAADAERLEGLLLESASKLPELEDLAEQLAQYRPEGGEYLFDFEWMKPRVAHHLAAAGALALVSHRRPICLAYNDDSEVHSSVRTPYVH